MNWKKLLYPGRLGSGKTSAAGSGRTEFQRDFDRVVFSSAFRRLQTKTQVFPLPETDFIHTRLTHSLEAACVGRSLGILVGNELENSGALEDGLRAEDVSAIVAAACLAHDLGNPPFGHSGEKAIGEFFRTHEGQRYCLNLDVKEKQDLRDFEGNAMGFRLLTQTLPAQSNIPGGLRLAYATLGAFTKYPRESVYQKHKNKKYAGEKKFGFFQAEKNIFSEVASNTGMIQRKDSEGNSAWARHPLAYLVEAADDICYTIMDLEDGCKLNLVTLPEAFEALREIVGNNFDPTHGGELMDRREQLGYSRAMAINTLTRACAETFINNHKSLLIGEFQQTLLDKIPQKDTYTALAESNFKKIYSCRKVVEIEVPGFEVLAGLLRNFINAYFEPESARSKKILQLIPEQYGIDPKAETGDYEIIMRIVQFVAGMTDTYAISLYRKLTGSSLQTHFG